jgi:hypothetical protein
MRWAAIAVVIIVVVVLLWNNGSDLSNGEHIGWQSYMLVARWCSATRFARCARAMSYRSFRERFNRE